MATTKGNAGETLWDVCQRLEPAELGTTISTILDLALREVYSTSSNPERVRRAVEDVLRESYSKGVLDGYALARSAPAPVSR